MSSLVLTQAQVDTYPAPAAGRGYSHLFPYFLIYILLWKWPLSSCSVLYLLGPFSPHLSHLKKVTDMDPWWGEGQAGLGPDNITVLNVLPRARH